MALITLVCMSFLSLSVTAGTCSQEGNRVPPDHRALVKSHVVLEGMHNVGRAVVTRTIYERICACIVDAFPKQIHFDFLGLVPLDSFIIPPHPPFDERIEEKGQTVANLRKDVHCHVLTWYIETLLNHL